MRLHQQYATNWMCFWRNLEARGLTGLFLILGFACLMQQQHTIFFFIIWILHLFFSYSNRFRRNVNKGQMVLFFEIKKNFKRNFPCRFIWVKIESALTSVDLNFRYYYGQILVFHLQTQLYGHHLIYLDSIESFSYTY